MHNYSYELPYTPIPAEYQYFDNPDYGGYKSANYCPVANVLRVGYDYLLQNCKVGTSLLESDYNEVIGDRSFCFISSLLPKSSVLNITEQAICYEVECDSNNKRINVHVGSSTISCPTLGGDITEPNGFKGKISCP